MLAVTTSDIQPLPHQLRAVYGELLPRTPLRFLLADDPGAGKTIMAGLYIKELILREDVKRCLIVAPGGLVDQWQDELYLKFGLAFEILTPQFGETVFGASAFEQHPLLIARMDQLARNEDLPGRAGEVRVGPRGRRRGPPHGRPLLRRQAREDQALPARRAARRRRAPPAADDRDPAQRQGGGLPALPHAAGPRPVRGQVPGEGSTPPTPRA